MLKNQGVLYLELIIDAKIFNTEDIAVESILICSNVLQLLPTCSILLYDVRNRFTRDITLADGMLIGILIGPDENTYTMYSFRVFSFEQVPYKGTVAYKIDCYWDAPQYLSKIATKYYEGTSSKVLSTVAGEAGLSAITDPTADSMIWIPRNKKYGHFAKEIALHGYASPTSTMCVGVNLLGQLVYRNLSTIPFGGPVFSRGTSETGGIMVYSAESINKAGFFNHYTGYNHRVVEQTVMKPVYFDTYDDVSVRKITNFLMLNKEVRGMISKGKREFVPFNTGNVHSHYQQAFYQNNRGMSMYNLGQHLIVHQHTDVQLLEPIVYRSDVETTAVESLYSQDRNDSGNYIVAGRNIQVLGGLHYSEKITVLRTGYNDDPSGTGTQL
jgi:hypothetical protein